MTARDARPWTLVFRETQPITVESCASALAAFAGGAVTIAAGVFDHDGHAPDERVVTITAQPPGGTLRFTLELMQRRLNPGDPNIMTSLCDGELVALAAPFADQLAAWGALRDAFAALGCTDHTLAWRPAPIVDAAEAACDHATAARLRAEITAALVAEARTLPFVTLVSTRADLAAVLAGYDKAADIRSIALEDCQLTALPPGIASRFAGVESLSWIDDAAGGEPLRGLALPRLTRLRLRGPALQRIARPDLAGFPALTDLVLDHSALAELDPEIIVACPALARVAIEGTPLAADGPQLAALRARWPAVEWV